MEIWKEIEGFEGSYEISNKGRVKSLIRKVPIIMNNKWDGRKRYYQIALSGNGCVKYLLIHRLVAIAFLQQEPGKITVNHKNGIKTDNTVENLEWASYSENIKHAWRTGLTVNTEKKRKATIKFNIETKSKMVIDTETGISYSSLTAAAKAFNMPISSLGRKLIGDLRNNTSLIYAS